MLLHIKDRVGMGFRPDNIYIGKGARYFVVVKDMAVLKELHRVFTEHPLNVEPSRYRLGSEYEPMYFYGFDLADTNIVADST